MIRAQTAMEFLLLLTGILIFVSLVFLLVQGTLFPQATGQIENNSDIIASMRAGLNATAGA